MNEKFVFNIETMISVLFVLCIICDVCVVLQMEAYDVAIKSCESVLREEPQNTKALFRKGKVSLDDVSIWCLLSRCSG